MRRIFCHIIVVFCLLGCFGGRQQLRAQNWDWCTASGSNAQITHYGIANDTNGNAYVVGGFSGTADFGNGQILVSQSGSRDMFVAKYDSAGGIVWAIGGGDTNDDCAFGIEVDASENVYITGHYTSALQLNGVSGLLSVTATGNKDAFVAKIDGNTGLASWLSTSAGPAKELGTGIALLSNGVFVSGSFESTSNFGTNALTSMGLADVFVARLDQGTGAWTQAVAGGTTQDDAGSDICSDGASLYVTGSYGNAAFSFGGTSLASAGLRDGFVAKLNANVVAMWSSYIQGAGTDELPQALAVDGQNVYVTGNMSGPGNLSFAAGVPLNASTAATGDNFWCVAFRNTDGVAQWGFVEGGAGNDRAFGITTSSPGIIALAGSFEQSLTLSGSIVLNASASDPFIYYIFSPAGMGINALTGTGAGNGCAYDICFDQGCGEFVAGDFDQTLTFDSTQTVATIGTPGGFASHYLHVGGGPAPVVSPTTDTICRGDSTTLQLTGQYDAVNWSASTDSGASWTPLPFMNASTITVAPPTTTMYLAKSNLACDVNFDTAWVTVLLPPMVSIVGLPDTMCKTDPPIAFSLLPANPLGTTTFTSAGYSNLGNGTMQFNPSSAGAGGPYPIYYFYTDSLGCSASATADVVVVVPITVSFTGLDSAYCASDTLPRNLVGNLNPLGDFSCASSGFTANPNGTAIFNPSLAPTDVPITIAYSRYNGCNNTVTGTTIVHSLPTPIVSGFDTSYCIGAGSDTLLGNYSNGGTFASGPWMNQISSGLAVVFPSYPGLQDTVLTIAYAVTDGFGCTGSVQWSSHLVAPPAANAGADDSICRGMSVQLGSASIPFVSYAWTCSLPGWSSTAPNPSYTPPANVVCYLEATESHGCKAVDSIRITVLDAPVADAGRDTSLCEGDSIILGGAIAASAMCSWQSDLGFTSTQAHPSFQPMLSDRFILTLSDSTGFCLASDTVVLTVAQKVTMVEAGDDQYLTGSTATMAALPPNVGQGTWSCPMAGLTFDDTHNPSAQISGLGNGAWMLYWTVANAPCPSGKDSVRLTVVALQYPSGFSPNGDGSNDLLVFRGLDHLPDNQLKVFNRWGNLVYSKTGYDNSWDGTRDGQLLVEDTYYYILEVNGVPPVNNFLVLKRE